MEIGWTDVGSGGYILVSCAHSNTSSIYYEVIASQASTNCNRLNLAWRRKREILYIQTHILHVIEQPYEHLEHT